MKDITPLLAIVGDDSRIDRLARELSLDGYAVTIAATSSALRLREPRVLRHRELQIDAASREVHFASSRLKLCRQEYAPLVHLARDPHRVFTGRELLSDVWRFHAEGSTKTLALHASRLRRKLALAGAGAGWIGTVWGVGYRLAAPTEESSPVELARESGRTA
ncbi:MAG TPA: winged helix-turn-helix domain-containing protein [Solirubrobacteraceae bacterium]|jgi:DNA-binding winged helix-turn-helix (wHTH) protein|nr:winged helix-turn-helix domain-containing protein [Solirubrobacteraceae bacterium]